MHSRKGALKLAQRREEEFRNSSPSPVIPSSSSQNFQPPAVAMQVTSSRTVVLNRHSEYGFGFSIRGGAEYGTGIFISHVNEFCEAFAQGLSPGDQIVNVNGNPFLHMYHDDAARYLNSMKHLRMSVFGLGIIPGQKFEQTQYQWLDAYGRPTSPPPPVSPRWAADASPRGLHHADDERKVNVIVGDGSKLGLLIRGGNEFGLGIYVAGIDENSVASKCGILVGEQIMEVNGLSFVDIRHMDAADILRTSRMMTIILKDVGKVPLSKTVYDHTEWVDGQTVSRLHLYKSQAFRPKKASPVFHPTIAGSQVRHQSVVVGPSTYGLLEDRSKALLSVPEQSFLRQIIQQYNSDHISVEIFVLSLLDLLNTNEKLGLVVEVRSIIRPRDIDQFDSLYAGRDRQVTRHRAHTNRIYLGQDRILSSPLAGETKGTGKPGKELQSILRRRDHNEPRPDDSIPGSSEDLKYFPGPELKSRGRPSWTIDSENSRTPAPIPASRGHGAANEEFSQIYAVPHKEKKKQKYSVIKLKNGDMDVLKNLYSDDIADVGQQFDTLPQFLANNVEASSARVNGSVDHDGTMSDGDTEDSSQDEYNSGGWYAHPTRNVEGAHSQSNNHAFKNGVNSRAMPDMKTSVIHGAISAAVDQTYDEFSEQSVSTDDTYQGPLRNRSPEVSSEELGFAFRFLDDEPLNVSKPTTASHRAFEEAADYESGIQLGRTKFGTMKSSKSFVKSATLQNYRPSAILDDESRGFKSRRQSSHIVDLDHTGSKSTSHNHATTHVENYKNVSPKSLFDTEPSLERRYAQFSVNDILRQEYLPTSSSDHDMFLPTDDFVDIRVDESFLTSEPRRHKKGYVLGSLNIQDQYEYEKTLNITKSAPVDDPSYSHYAKPVIMKSPRPEFPLTTTATNANPIKLVNISTNHISHKANSSVGSPTETFTSTNKITLTGTASNTVQKSEAKLASTPLALGQSHLEKQNFADQAKPSEDPVLLQLRARQEKHKSSSLRNAEKPDGRAKPSTINKNGEPASKPAQRTKNQTLADRSAELMPGSIASRIKSFDELK